MIISNTELDSIILARNSHPHSSLGLHPCKVDGKSGLVARAYIHDAVTCEVVRLGSKNEKRYPLKKLHDSGFFEAFIGRIKKPFKYRLRVTYINGAVSEFYDPYSFLPTLEEEDLHLFSGGNNLKAYDKFGGH